MLSIRIGQSEIPQDPSISLPLVLRSPFFLTDQGKVPGSYIFNTRFPASDSLRREFSQAHRMQRHGRATAELPYLITHGILRFQGMCVVTQADPDGYEIAFKIDNGDLASRLKDKTLKDLDLGGDREITSFYTNVYSPGYSYEEMRGENTAIFEIEEPLRFDQVAMDISNSYSVPGYSFTAPFTGSVTLNIRFSIAFLLDIIKLRLYKNAVLLHEYPLSGGTMNHIIEPLNITQGDVYELKVWARSIISVLPYPEPIGDITRNTIRFTFFYGSFLEYWIPNEFDINSSKTQDDSDYALFPVSNPDFLSNFPDDAFQLDNLSLKTLYTEYFTVQNYYNDRFPLFLSGLQEGELLFAANLFTPFVYLDKLLRQIASEAGYELINSPFEHEFKGAVLFNAFAENTYTGDDTRLTPVKPSFNLVDHVPTIKQSDFLNWISQLTGYFPMADNNLCTITFVSVKELHIESPENPSIPFPGILLPGAQVKVDPEYKGIKVEMKAAGTDQYQGQRIKELDEKLILKGSVPTINSLPPSGNAVNDMYLVTSDNSFYVWQYNPDTYSLTWRFFSRDWPLSYQEGEEPFLDISTEFSPVLTTYIKDENLGAPENRFWTLPVTHQPGILEGFPDSLGSEYGIQLLFYCGMALDSKGEAYPLGTSRTEDYANDIFTNLNARDIFTQQYQDFLRWIAFQAKPVTVKAVLTTSQLKKIRFENIYRYQDMTFLIRSIKTQLDSMELKTIQLEFLIL